MLNPIEAIAKMIRGLFKDLLKSEIRAAAQEAVAESEAEFRQMVANARRDLLPAPESIATVQTNGRAKKLTRAGR